MRNPSVLIKMHPANQGFTLLELLLVLTLMTTLVVSGLGWYQIKLRNFKVDKTALQMQQWLQAGMAFYLDCNQWPPDSSLDSNIIPAMMGDSTYTQNECPTLKDKTRIYMPKGSDANGPWSYTDDAGKLMESGYQIAPIKNPDGSDSQVFSVSTMIGINTEDKSYNNTLSNSAQMIAGRLPNASVADNDQKDAMPVSISAYVNSQGSSGGSKNGFIVGIENVDSTTLSHIKTKYNCPTGFQYHYYYALSKFKGAGEDVRPREGAYQAQVDITQQNNVYSPNITITTDGNSSNPPTYNGTDNGILLISTCMPVQQNKQADNTNSTQKKGWRF